AIELKRKLGEAELGTRAASRNLLILLGFPPDDALLTETEITHLGEWESEIQHSHQDHDYLVKPYELRSVETDLAAKEVARTWIPRIDAYAGWNQYNQREEDPPSARERQEHVIGVRLEMSLFDGFSAQREAEALHKEALAAKLAALYYRKENEAHVETEFDELRFLHDRVHEADENIKSAQKYYRITQSEYARGVKNSPDVLGASEKLFDMKLKRLEMVRDFQIARSHVLSKIGK
ncbi:MAG: TolC family protein, partial [Bdellovibrionales bacterium]